MEPRHPDAVVEDLLIELSASRATLGDAGEWVQSLERTLARVESFVTSEIGALDRSGEWREDGARDVTAWLMTRCRLARSSARRQLRRARALDSLPGFGRAWSAGEITGSHVDVVAAIQRCSTADALRDGEDLLVGHARTLRFSSYCRAVAYAEQLADPDGADSSDEERRARRGVQLSQSFAGTWLGSMTLDAISGEIVSGELERIYEEMFTADWARAREVHGREPLVSELERTARQRRADALVEMATRSATAPADARRPAPLFSVLVGYESLHGRICELASGTVVAPGSLVRLLDEAVVERAVFSPGRRVEIGQRTRLFAGATRRALELRDRRCTHPYCEEPVGRCEADHVRAYSDGGETTQENGRLLCSFHNRLAYRERHGRLHGERPPPGR